MNPRKKSGLNSASRSSTCTSLNWSGKLFEVQPFAWQASRLCVMSRTIVCSSSAQERRGRAELEEVRAVKSGDDRRPEGGAQIAAGASGPRARSALGVASGLQKCSARCSLPFISSATMPRPPSPSIPEKEFLYSSLKESLRLDGRNMLEMRTPTLTFGPELGWIECALGKTRYAV